LIEDQINSRKGSEVDNDVKSIIDIDEMDDDDFVGDEDCDINVDNNLD